MPRYHLTPVSANAKTGPIPVSTSSADTCPTVCPFRGSGCYADSGPLGLHWLAVTRAKRGTNWRAFLDAVRGIAPGALWRHNQAGDLPGMGNRIARRALEQLVAAARHTRAFTYTHKPVTGSSALARANREAVRAANAAGFTVNLSANNLAHADQLADTGAGPVVTVLAPDAPAVSFTPAGRRVVVCPAQTRDTVTCASCGLCARRDRRGIIVGFLAHGARKRLAAAVAAAA
jgi:hypothetical protein